MKKIKLIAILLIFTVPVFGFFEFQASSPRAIGMGNSVHAFSIGVHSMQYNPATIAYITSLEFMSFYGNPFLGLDDNTSGQFLLNLDFAIAAPFSQKNFLIPFRYLFKGLTLNHEDLIVKQAAMGLQFHQFSVANFMYERQISMVYAKNLNDVLFKGANLSAGINFNLYQVGYTSLGEISKYGDNSLGTDKTTFGIDVGVTYDFSRDIRIAFVYKNLLTPNFSFFKDGKDLQPSSMVYALSWKYGLLLGLEDTSFTGSYVINNRQSGDNRKTENEYKLGAEFFKFDHMLGVRFGYEFPLNSIDLGLSFEYLISGQHNIGIYYATTYPISMNTKNLFSTSKQYVSIEYKFIIPDYLLVNDEQKIYEYKEIAIKKELFRKYKYKIIENNKTDKIKTTDSDTKESIKSDNTGNSKETKIDSKNTKKTK